LDAVSTPCVYCGLDGYNVFEVRYARTIKSASMSKVSEDDAPREIIGRGYFLCDGCLALLDWHEEHHLDPRRHGLYNVFSAAYHVFLIWAVAAVFSLASTLTLLSDDRFLAVGIVAALLALAAWFVRASVHSRYYGEWRGNRADADVPRNSLGAFTDLRDRVNPELAAYLPVRYEDSVRLAGLPGSPPIRSIGPRGEPWGQGPETNFAARGDNDWYRLVWISWRLWPLTHVEVPDGAEWRPPRGPRVHEAEVAAATAPAVGLGATLVALGLSPLHGVIGAAALSVLGFFGGRAGLRAWRRRERRKHGAMGG
jgi:hypothetical protein